MPGLAEVPGVPGLAEVPVLADMPVESELAEMPVVPGPSERPGSLGTPRTPNALGPVGGPKSDDVARAGESPGGPVEPRGEPLGDMSAAGPGVAEITESTELPLSRAR